MLTLVKSSLNLIHGRPPTDDNLITIFNALLFSPEDAILKSFVRKVPIPNATVTRIRDQLSVVTSLGTCLSKSLVRCTAAGSRDTCRRSRHQNR